MDCSPCWNFTRTLRYINIVTYVDFCSLPATEVSSCWKKVVNLCFHLLILLDKALRVNIVNYIPEPVNNCRNESNKLSWWKITILDNSYKNNDKFNTLIMQLAFVVSNLWLWSITDCYLLLNFVFSKASVTFKLIRILSIQIICNRKNSVYVKIWF